MYYCWIWHPPMIPSKKPPAMVLTAAVDVTPPTSYKEAATEIRMHQT